MTADTSQALREMAEIAAELARLQEFERELARRIERIGERWTKQPDTR